MILSRGKSMANEFVLDNLDFFYRKTFCREEVLFFLDKIIEGMPNGGKLYKYRKFDTHQFANTYDSLEKGYLWLSSADKLNDDIDAVIHFDHIEQLEKIVNFIKKYPGMFARGIFRRYQFDVPMPKPLEKYYVNLIKDGIDDKTGEVKVEQTVAILVKSGMNRKRAKEIIIKLKNYIDESSKNEEKIARIANDYLNINKKVQEECYIFSMSEDYDSDSMWAYYADNQGFCIEYDYNKLKELPTENILNALSVYKVIYKKEFEEYNFVNLFEIYMTEANLQQRVEKSKEILLQLITKGDNWDKEKEWRILLEDFTQNKLSVDIVSGIIIDQKALKNVNAKKLIELCEQKHWPIKIRRPNITRTGHEYIDYNIQ